MSMGASGMRRVLCIVALELLLVDGAHAFVQHPGLMMRRSTARYAATRPAATQLEARFMGNDQRHPSSHNLRVDAEPLSRRDMNLFFAAGSALLLAPNKASAAEQILKMPVVVIGAAGLTGGDTVRTLLSANMPVVALTRRAVNLTSRDKLKTDTRVSKDTLVLNKASDSQQLRTVVADALLPETLSAALQGARAVIYCAGSRPKVKVTITPGTNPGGKNGAAAQDGSAAPDVQGGATLSSASYTQFAGTEGVSVQVMFFFVKSSMFYNIFLTS